MDTIEGKNRLHYMLFYDYVGCGTNSICFKDNNDKLYKIFFSKLINNNETINYFNELSTYNNDTYIAPSELILNNDNNCIGYTSRYINSKTLKYIKGNIYDIFNGFEKLVEDTKDISDKKLLLKDIHNNNILFNNEYHIIDLDASIKETFYSTEDIFKFNMNHIMESILYSIFNVSRENRLDFMNHKYTNLRIKKSDEYKYFYDLIDELVKNNETEDIRLIRKKTGYTSEFNDYYRQL